ncbi:hypothetical protein M1446_00395 [Candidatus Dependentiae bacterium]|nr:hypothetical protein [Candidatus Dependentiae bacterium]
MKKILLFIILFAMQNNFGMEHIVEFENKQIIQRIIKDSDQSNQKLDFSNVNAELNKKIKNIEEEILKKEKDISSFMKKYWGGISIIASTQIYDYFNGYSLCELNPYNISRNLITYTLLACLCYKLGRLGLLKEELIDSMKAQLKQLEEIQNKNK